MRGRNAVKKYVKELPRSATKEQAKLRAGYSKKTNTSTIESSKTFQELIQKELPDSDAVKAFKEAMRATKLNPLKKREPDHFIRKEVAKEVFKLKGRYKQLEGQTEPMKIEIEVKE
jgi:hypothetical protein